MDIVVAVVLCVINARIVKKKNRSTVGMTAITLGLTLGVVMILSVAMLLINMPNWGITEDMTSQEMLETVVAGMSDYILYITYIPLVVGGAISFLIARKMKYKEPKAPVYMQGYSQPGQVYGQNQMGQGYGQPGQVYGQNPMGQSYGQNPAGPVYGQPYGQPMPQPAQMYAEPYDEEKMLATPCTICVIREQSAAGAGEVYTISLNGYHACQLANGTFANIMTNRKQNTITARDGAGASLPHPITFLAVEGGYVEIHIGGGAFIPEKTIGRKPVSQN